MAEHEARNKRRKVEGKPPLPIEGKPTPENGNVKAIEDEESNKRRKLLQEALELDKDDSESEGEEANGENKEDEDERLVRNCCCCFPLPYRPFMTVKVMMMTKTTQMNC